MVQSVTRFYRPTGDREIGVNSSLRSHAAYFVRCIRLDLGARLARIPEIGSEHASDVLQQLRYVGPYFSDTVNLISDRIEQGHQTGARAYLTVTTGNINPKHPTNVGLHSRLGFLKADFKTPNSEAYFDTEVDPEVRLLGHVAAWHATVVEFLDKPEPQQLVFGELTTEVEALNRYKEWGFEVGKPGSIEPATFIFDGGRKRVSLERASIALERPHDVRSALEDEYPWAAQAEVL